MFQSRNGIFPLAVRAKRAAAMLDVSENTLREWVDEGKVHKPFTVRKRVVLYDAATLASDWERLKEEAEASDLAAGADETEEGPNPWDDVLR